MQLLLGDPVETIERFVEDHGVAAVVTDFSPLRVGRQWRDGLAASNKFAVYEVDAHNVVPCWMASEKLRKVDRMTAS